MKSTTKLAWAICTAVAVSIIVGLISYNSLWQRYQKQKTEKSDFKKSN